MNSRLAFGLVVLLTAGMAAAILFQPPAWIVLLVGSAIMAAIFVVARRKTDYEALDPTFRSHIPTIRKQPENRSGGRHPTIGLTAESKKRAAPKSPVGRDCRQD
jgi:hypothetical protein